MDGVLIIDKPQGPTSFAVVARLRRLLGVNKMGHGGTLDPNATGVLPILVGQATKLMAYLVEYDKEYVATVRLGVVTDTQDATGVVIRQDPVPPFTGEEIRRVLSRFTGTIQQVPPMHSALHHEGERLYALARAGVTVERPPRTICIHALDLLDMEQERLTIRVVCSKGTYVRTLVADIGATLGCGGSLWSLVRTRMGPLRLEDAVPWSAVEGGDRGLILAHLRPTDWALGHLPVVTLPSAQAADLLKGKAVVPPSPLPAGPKPILRVYAADGGWLGLGEGTAAGMLKPLRLFHVGLSRPRRVSSR